MCISVSIWSNGLEVMTMTCKDCKGYIDCCDENGDTEFYVKGRPDKSEESVEGMCLWFDEVD